MAVQTFTAENFEEKISKGTVLVDFWASWCGPCRILSPLVDKVAEEHSEILTGKVNVDDEGELAARYGIFSIPTLILFRDGKEVNRSVGAIPEEKLLAFIKS